MTDRQMQIFKESYLDGRNTSRERMGLKPMTINDVERMFNKRTLEKRLNSSPVDKALDSF